MDNRLCLSVCSQLVAEVNYVIKNGDFPDVVVKSYPANCIKKHPHSVQDYSPADTIDYSKILYFQGGCELSKEKKFGNGKIETIQLEQCFGLVTSQNIITHFINKGYYVASTGWLLNYKQHIKEWGFDAITAKTFFRESMKKLVLLDTGIHLNYLPKLKALSEFMGLPYEIFPVGISYCTHYINSLVLKWRSDEERNSLNDKLSKTIQEVADYFMIFDQLGNLVNKTEEHEIVQDIFMLLNILFAPRQILYKRFENGDVVEEIYSNEEINEEIKDHAAEIALDIKHQNETMGIFELYKIKFPEYIIRYRKIGKVISQLGSLSIANARKYRINEEQKNQLKELNASKDKFFSILAHDLRSPLTSFITFTEHISSNIYNMAVDDIQRFAVIMNKQASNLYKLLENLLEWSKINQGILEYNPISLNLSNLANQALQLLFQSAKKKDIDLTLDIPDTVKINADIRMTETILRNLVSNAIKFTPAHGSILVSIKEEENNLVRIMISDNGIGMNPEMKKKLFFIDSNISRPGTEGEASSGLGLLLCKEFVEKQGGEIWVDSIENKGSTFHFSLPQSND